MYPDHGPRSQAQRLADARLLVESARREGNLSEASETLYVLGVIFDNLHLWGQAIEVYSELLSCAEQLGNTELQLLARNS